MWSDSWLWFWFAFHWRSVILSIFSCTYWPSVWLLWKNVYSDPLSLFKLYCLFFCCWVIWVLYIFWILTPYQLCDLQMFFPHSVGCLFILLIVSFAVQKLFSLMTSHLFFSLHLMSNPKNYRQRWWQGAYWLCFLLGIL